MTTSHLLRLRTLCAIGAITVLASCGDDTVLNPVFGANCSSGALRAGETVTGKLNQSSCIAPYHFWNSNQVSYTSYDVTLEKGKGYHFLMRAVPDEDGFNNVDALLTLWGKNSDGASLPLAISDDDANGAGGYDSEFFFVAPRSGTFQLVAASYESTDSGGFRLSMQRCPVVGGKMDTAGTYENIDFGPTNCIIDDLNGFTTRIVLVAIPVDSAEEVSVSVTSDDFPPVLEFGGPGFDVYSNIYDDETDYSTGLSNVSVGPNPSSGILTLAVGSEMFDPVGKFSVEITRTAPVSLMAPPSLRTLGQMSLRPVAERAPKPVR